MSLNRNKKSVTLDLKTPEGQEIDISMLDCQVSILENAIARYTAPPTPDS